MYGGKNMNSFRFWFVQQADNNDDTINTRIKKKTKQFYDSLKQFHYRIQLPGKNHFFICYAF
jgi:hypothetical protein